MKLSFYLSVVVSADIFEQTLIKWWIFIKLRRKLCFEYVLKLSSSDLHLNETFKSRQAVTWRLSRWRLCEHRVRAGGQSPAALWPEAPGDSPQHHQHLPLQRQPGQLNNQTSGGRWYESSLRIPAALRIRSIQAPRERSHSLIVCDHRDYKLWYVRIMQSIEIIKNMPLTALLMV